MMSNNDVVMLGKANYMNTYNSYPLSFVKGEDCYLIDADGKKYLDMVSGIAVNALGYNNRALSNKLKEVIDCGIFHTSNLFYNEYAVSAAAKINHLAESKKVFFCNSGTEANEAALKLVRHYGSKSGRYKIIAFGHSFHGRSYGSLSLTGQEKYQKGFGPLLDGIEYAVFNDLESVNSKLTDDVVAIFVEPIQGEGGIVKAEKSFLEGLRAICDEKDLFLVFDEVQCGMGRTGYPFAFQYYGIKPDLMTLAKALGCGLPIGALVSFEKGANVFSPSNHASTFGGNYLATAAASVILSYLEDKGFMAHINEVSEHFETKLNELHSRYNSLIVEVKGVGLMKGLKVSIPPSQIINNAMSKGLLVCSASTDVVRFVPPLVISKKDIDMAFDILVEVFNECLK